MAHPSAREGELRPVTGPAARAFARVVVALRWLVVPAWIAAAVACVVYLPGIGGLQRAPLTGLVPADAEALQAQERSLELFDIPLLGGLAVVMRDPGGLSEDEQVRVVEHALATARGETELEDVFAIPVLNTLGVFPSASEAGTTAITYLFLPPAIAPLEQVTIAQEYARTLVNPRDDAYVGVTGALAARDAEADAIQTALPWVEGATVALIFVILAVAFRSVVAPLLTLFAAGIALVVAERIAGSAAAEMGLIVPREAQPLMVVLLLGIVTDYAVFFLTGTRRRLAAGVPRVEAAWWTAAQYTPIISTAGLIVALGAATILVGRLDFFRAFGPGLALTVVVGLLVALTLVPALLAIFGRFAFWPSTPDRFSPDEEEVGPQAWRRRVSGLVARRWAGALVVVASVAVLGVAASGLARIDLALTPIRGLAGDAQPLKAFEQAAAGFAPGIVAPTEVLVEGDGVAADPQALERLDALLRRQPGVAGVLGPPNTPELEGVDVFATKAGDAVRYLVVLEEHPYSSHAIALVAGLDESLPDLLAEAGLDGAEAVLAGDTALAWQSVNTIKGDLVRIAIAVVLVNAVLLALFLRSLVAPLYLVGASALALAAALGLATYFFHGILGYPDMTYYVPLAAGVLLVSLGADYNLFVVGRIWQEARRGPFREAIAVAAPRASRAVTIAGVTLAFSFALLAIVPLASFREFAFIMSVGILLDTFLVRSLLVPGLISVVGERSWWPGRPRKGAAAAG